MGVVWAHLLAAVATVDVSSEPCAFGQLAAVFDGEIREAAPGIQAGVREGVAGAGFDAEAAGAAALGAG